MNWVLRLNCSKMIDKSKYLCIIPFIHTDVYDDRQFLCSLLDTKNKLR